MNDEASTDATRCLLYAIRRVACCVLRVGMCQAGPAASQAAREDRA
jgi:hypothetical protein